MARLVCVGAAATRNNLAIRSSPCVPKMRRAFLQTRPSSEEAAHCTAGASGVTTNADLYGRRVKDAERSTLFLYSRISAHITYNRVRGEFKVVVAPPCNAITFFQKGMLKAYAISC